MRPATAFERVLLLCCSLHLLLVQKVFARGQDPHALGRHGTAEHCGHVVLVDVFVNVYSAFSHKVRDVVLLSDFYDAADGLQGDSALSCVEAVDDSLGRRWVHVAQVEVRGLAVLCGYGMKRPGRQGALSQSLGVWGAGSGVLLSPLQDSSPSADTCPSAELLPML